MWGRELHLHSAGVGKVISDNDISRVRYHEGCATSFLMNVRYSPWEERSVGLKFRSHPRQSTKESCSEAHGEPEQNDATLVRAAQADVRAFGPLYERYLGEIYRYCHVRLGDREAAEDATSEVFLKALRALDGYQGGTFIAWLYKIASNVIVDIYRRRHRQLVYPIETADYIEDGAPTPEMEAITRAEHTELCDAMALLPHEYRTVLEMQLAGWRGEQIASAMGRSPAAVKMLRFRAMTRLREVVCSLGQREKSEVYHE